MGFAEVVRITCPADSTGAMRSRFRTWGSSGPKRRSLDLGRVVDGMRLVGCVRRRRAYPFITEDEDGNRFKMMTSAAVRNYSRASEQIEEIIPEAAIQQHSQALDGSVPTLM